MLKFRPIVSGIIIVFVCVFVIFAVIYQRMVVSRVKGAVAEHAAVISPLVWNYDANYVIYLALVAEAQNYAQITMRNPLGDEDFTLAGPPPARFERWLMRVKLIPLREFEAAIEHRGEQIGALAVVWRNTTIYAQAYAALCLLLAGVSAVLFARVIFANKHLEERVRERTAELAAANAALRAGEQQFRDIAKNVPGMVYQFRARSDGSIGFTYTSPGGQSLFGLSEDLTHADWHVGTHSHPDDRERLLAGIRASIAACADWEYEGRIVQPDGRVKWFEGLASPTRLGDEVIFNGILLDITARKQAEQELAQSEAQLRALLRTLPDLVWLKDPDGVYLRCNARFEALYGAPETAIIGHADDDFVHREQAEFFRHHDRAAVAADKPTINEEEVTFHDGHVEALETIKTPVYASDGQLIGILGIGRNITRRKQTEEALRASERNFKLMVDSSPLAILLTTGSEERVIYMNRRFIELFGYTSDDIDWVADWWPLAYPDEAYRRDIRQQWQAYVEVAMREAAIREDAKTPPMESRVTCKDGTHRIVEWALASRGGQNIVHGLDITDRKQAEEALRASETRYRLLVEMAAEGIWSLDVAHVTVYVNQTMADMLGHATEDMLGKPVEDFLFPDDIPAHQEHMRARRAGQGEVYERRLRRKDGSPLWALISARALTDDDGHFTGSFGMLTDITDRKRAEAELRRHREHLEDLVKERTAALEQEIIERKHVERALLEAKEAAEKANRAKSAFLANMSHELRTPLNAILGFSQLMTRDPEITANQRENLSIVNRSGDHLLTLINDILDMSKIEAGRSVARLSACNLNRMLTGLTDMLRLRAEQKGLGFVVTCAPHLPRSLETDERKLRQILINLLSNAIKFTERGEVRLMVDVCQPPGPRAHPSPITLQCAVHDTGPGIAPEHREQIFEPFAQVGDGLASSEGTGLGLAISRQFARLMGGDITVSSQPGVGSVFTLTFPTYAREVSARDAQEDAPLRRAIAAKPNQRAADGGPYRVLIVEDKTFNRLLLQRVLQAIDAAADGARAFDVRTAAHGGEAVDLNARWRPHLIFMDLRMPVMDGYAATQAIRERGGDSPAAGSGFRSPVIIALTASVFEEHHQQVLDAGCDDFIRKPFCDDEIFEKLARYLGVEFIYAEEPPVAATDADAAARDGRSSFALPPDVLIDLEQAANRSNMNQVAAIITTIRGHDAGLADGLQRLADAFDYDAILSIIRNAGDAEQITASGG